MRSLLFLLGMVGCFGSFFLWACGSPASKEEVVQTPPKDSLLPPPAPALHQVGGMPVVLVVRTALAPIYERPDLAATIVAHYQKEDSLIFTNRVTQNSSRQTIEGFTYEEPWLRVLLPNEQMAWIYGAHVSFDAQAQPELAQLVLLPRAATLFGEALAQQMGIYQQEVGKTLTLPGFRALYTRAQHIKDSLELHLANYHLSNPATEQTDFFWLNEVLDGLLLHYIAEQKKHYLFRDLRYWKEISFQTPDTRDDAFMDLLLACYPADSIAYYYYGWQLPLGEDSLCSLLGSGIHAQVFGQLDSCLDSSSYFRPEVQHIKQALVDDISTTLYFWMPLPAVQSELDSILNKNYSFLSVSDRVALKTKRSFFNTPQEHQLVLNLFEEG